MISAHTERTSQAAPGSAVTPAAAVADSSVAPTAAEMNSRTSTAKQQQSAASPQTSVSSINTDLSVFESDDEHHKESSSPHTASHTTSASAELQRHLTAQRRTAASHGYIAGHEVGFEAALQPAFDTAYRLTAKSAFDQAKLAGDLAVRAILAHQKQQKQQQQQSDSATQSRTQSDCDADSALIQQCNQVNSRIMHIVPLVDSERAEQ